MRILAALFLIASLGHADTDLRSQLGPVGDQADRNTCSAFEAVTLAEFLLEQKSQKQFRLSENYNYYAAKNFALSTDYLKSLYAHVDGMAAYLAVEALNSGIMLEAQWPYDPENGVTRKESACTGDSPPTTCFTGTPPQTAQVTPLKVKSVFIPRDQIRSYLETNKRPVLMNIHWYFDLADKKGNVRMPTKQEAAECTGKGTNCGGHVIMLVGYLSQSQRFIFRSSWGARWGSNGYGTMPESFVKEQCEACQSVNDTSLSPDERDLVNKASQGVSAELE